MSTLPPKRAPGARVVDFFRRHPVLLLFALTPGIPEYLSGSTAFWPVVLSPFGFLLFLGLNLGLYGAGVLLVREAHVRWKKGWSTILLLGAAYALLEEGTALSTLFNPKAPVVGGLGVYGHAYGVSWVWLIGILGVHIVYSVGLPILLLGLALPETRGQPFLTGSRLPLTAGIYVFDIVLLVYISHYYVDAAPLLALAAVAAGLLWLVAWRMPTGRFDPPRAAPGRGPRFFLILGLLYFALLILVPGIIREVGLPAIVAAVADLSAIVLLFFGIWREIGRSANEPELIFLAVGTIVPLAGLGLLAQWFLPVVIGPDLLAIWFFVTIWRKYRPPPQVRALPVGGMSG
ncbi:MAG: hypothetical protein L3K02_01390 [Thermoplasmata archaeon]|nr:hypothetical protein [Thermoplasmata archaeon]